MRGVVISKDEEFVVDERSFSTEDVLWATGIWALFDEQPAYVFTFPNNTADGWFHLATGTIFAAIAAIQIALDRRRPAGRVVT